MFRAKHTLNKEEWISVLKLSHMWNFDSVRTRAIEELARVIREPAKRLVLARSFQISGWKQSALLELAQKDALSAEDLEALGWVDAAKLLVVRDSVEFRDTCTFHTCQYCHPRSYLRSTPVVSVTRQSYDFMPKLREVFGTDLY